MAPLKDSTSQSMEHHNKERLSWSELKLEDKNQKNMKKNLRLMISDVNTSRQDPSVSLT